MSYDGKRCEDICKHAPPQKGKWPCEDCDMRYHDRAEKQTNADRIRAMTDEELAEWIYQVQDGDAYQKENYLPPLSKSWWLKWLKQEADHA